MTENKTQELEAELIKVPLGDNGEVSVDEADDPISELSEQYIADADVGAVNANSN